MTEEEVKVWQWFSRYRYESEQSGWYVRGELGMVLARLGLL